MICMDWDVLIPQDAQGEWDAASAGDRSAATATAVAVLHSLSGQTVGIVTCTVRPIPDIDRPSTYQGNGGGYPTVLSGIVPSISDIVNGGSTSNATVITLDGPVVAITEVRVGGQLLDPAAYRIDGVRLVRIDGEPWPTQDIAAPDDDPWSVVVVYQRGVEADPAARLAAGLLALEVLRGAAGDGACRLPPNVVNINRQGVNIEIDPAAYLEAGLTGVPYVDQWVRQVNPTGLRTQPTIVVPERRRSRR